MEYIIIGLLAFVIMLQLLSMLIGKGSSDIKSINDRNAVEFQNVRESIYNSVSSNSKAFEEQRDILKSLHTEIIKENRDSMMILQKEIKESLQEIQTSNEKRLQSIQANVNQKLDTSLNERLDHNFKQVGEQLQSLYKSLGELQTLSSGVTNLQKTLSNVKRRGVFGEVQLGNILADVMDASQYETNVITKKSSNDPVEFCVKIPDKDGKGSFIWLPIDSKFPADIYDRIVAASENADADALKAAAKELAQRIKTEALTIRDKYIDPPNTTDFAVMFLPTESLYAEVLRIPGLMEECQNKKIVIAGPSTLVALLNSLSIGFRYLTVNKNSQEILKTLSAVKAQYDKFGELIESASKKLDGAQKATELLATRNEMISKKLSKIELMEGVEAERLLGITAE